MKSLLIRKVKYLPKAEKIKIDYMKNGDEFNGTFTEPAAPEFYTALQNLTGPVCTICELNPEKFQPRIEPFGVTYSYAKEGEVMRASIQSKFHMPQSDTDTVLNTPSRTVSTEVEDGVDELTCNLLLTLEAEARKYLKGQRAQQNLFTESGEVNVTPEPEQISEHVEE